LEGFHQAFSFLDKNHNGSISAKEVHTITKRFHGTKPELLELQARVRSPHACACQSFLAAPRTHSQSPPPFSSPCQFDMSPYINNTGELVEEAFFAAVRDKRNADGLSMDEVRRPHAVANRKTLRGFGWEMSSRGRFATPAEFPRHDCSPYSHVHVRRESLGFVSRSRTILCRPVPNPNVRFATFSSNSVLPS
jgi:hypothetical protein